MLFIAHNFYRLRSDAMRLVNLLLWPGTVVCGWIGVDPEADMGLIRSMFNMIIYLVVILGALWIIL